MMNVRLHGLVGLLIGLLALGCEKEEEQREVLLNVVSLATVQSVDLDEELRASGDLRARFHTTIAAEVEGRVTGISVEEGGAVDQDAVVIEIDPARRQLDVEAAGARLAQSRAKQTNDRHQAQRIRKLRGQNVASEQQLEEAETALLLATSNVEADRAALGVAERALADASVRAPFAGLVAKRSAQLGQFVQKGTPIFEIVALDPLEVVFNLTELDTQLVAVGQIVEVRVGAFPDEQFEGRVTFVSPTVDPATRTLRIKAEIANPEAALRPGLFARVSLGLNRRNDVKMVPVDAVVRRAAGSHVFRMAEGDRVVQVPIETGAQQGERIEVMGLAAGDVIVHRGHAGLVEGAQVRVRGNNGESAVAAQGRRGGEGT
ncbi:MAG: efflux RND transporter periplasmic adaptor subunit [Myxococcota bacterium]|jgi:membrane fusion protein (multidrug efflux system)|nr:efflux RND transporter periplasmic adaptor subunit [Myxococcota bacterium]